MAAAVPSSAPIYRDNQGRIVLKIIALGASLVGKTTLTARFVKNVFLDSPGVTVGLEMSQKIISDYPPGSGQTIVYQMWDTAGQERFATLSSVFFRGSNGVALIYDVGNRESFHMVRNWRRLIDTYFLAGSMPIVMIGNKVDLRVPGHSCVTTEEGANLCYELDIPFFETSAKTGVGVDKAFYKLLDLILSRYPTPPPVGQQDAASATVPITSAALQPPHEPCCLSRSKLPLSSSDDDDSDVNESSHDAGRHGT